MDPDQPKTDDATKHAAEPSLHSILEIVQRQLQEAAAREQRHIEESAARESHLTNLLERAFQPTAPTAPRLAARKPVSAERPTLLSSATFADFIAWEEAWDDYFQCQHLIEHDRPTRVAAIRQALDEDLRRYIREGVITLATDADSKDYVTALRHFIRRQRNPLLDRVDFYNRHQSQGESFDSFYTSLNELFKASDFRTSLCSSCTGKLCNTCRESVRQRHSDMLRDRIVCGVYQDDLRHKLLASSALTLEDAVKLCRAEEAASMTNDDLPSFGQVNATRRQSAYRRQKSSGQRTAHTSGGHDPPRTVAKCPDCGRTPHTKNPCPAIGQTCNNCHRQGHFQSMCPEGRHTQPLKVGQLKLRRASYTGATTVDVLTRLNTVAEPVTLSWIPDTGSDVDAISTRQLTLLGGFTENIDTDPDVVHTASGSRLDNVGRISATLYLGDAHCNTTIHVYHGLKDALLSHQTLTALGLLPPGWPAVRPTHPRICQLQPVTHPSPGDLSRIREELLHEFADVFDDSTLKPMNGPPMDIQLTNDARPSHINGARAIPYAFRDQIKTQLDDMAAEGIIEPVSEPADWCHPIVIVNKKGTSEKRLTVDLRKLNDQVRRPTHPMTTPREALSTISMARFFTTLDARHGYWQIPLSDAAKPLTTFITPWGRFRFCRNPQGLISAGDEFNRRTDAAHIQHVRDTLQRAREHGVTFSAKKFIFGAEEVPFCGFVVNSQGWTMDSTKTAAIRDFPTPCNRTDLRSFFGLINQCSPFSPRLSELSRPLRPLLKTCNEFTWDAEHTSAFTNVKTALVSTPLLAHFQLGQPLRLETDASVLHGLGYVLWQQQGEHWCLLECGSRFLSDAESRYAVIELECLAVVWAVKKCSLFLQGAQFELVTDHRPLIPILNSYSLDQIENPRLQRLVLKLRPYQLHALWRKGSDNAFADALSRHPVQSPTSADEHGEDPFLSNPSVRACLRDNHEKPISDLRLHKLLTAAKNDPEYQLLLNTIQHGFPLSKADLPPSLSPYWNGREHLSFDNGLALKGERIVVPFSLRRSVLQDLHAAHQGLTRTKQRARQSVFWPNLTNDIDNLIRSCPECRLYASSQPKEPLLVVDRNPSLPFESTSSDIFTCQGWQYLVYVDRLTGWPCVNNLGRFADSACVIRHLRRWFADLGVPQILTTDGGPHFASRRFTEFCEQWQIRHVTSSPHYPQSNGHAEAAVKAMKHLVLKTTRNGNLDVDAFQRALLEWRNTPGASNFSPAQKLFGRPLDSFVFARRSRFSPVWQEKFIELDSDKSSRTADLYNTSAQPLSNLSPGTHVDVQHPRNKRWQQHGVIVSIGRHRDYFIRLPSGRVLRRNRRFLRPRILPAPAPPTDEPAQPATGAAPRRSTRPRRPPQRLDITSTSGQSYI